MTLYGTALFLHIIFAILLVGGTAWLHLAASLVKRSTTVAAARAHVHYISAVTRAAMPIAVLTLLPALYMAFDADLWGNGWPVVALALFLTAGGLAGRVGDPATARLKATLDEAPDGPMTPELGRSLADPKLTVAAWLMTSVDVGIVALMTNKPGYVGSVAVAAVVIVVGAALGVRENRHAAAAVVPPAAPPTAGAAPA